MMQTKSNRKERQIEAKVTQAKIISSGRRMCNCMARIHGLINNCLSCGRIICEQEGEGPCFFCGNQVFSSKNELLMAEDAELQARLDKDFEYLESYVQAYENMDKIIKYEKNSIANKNIIDDETDWYEIKNDVWQSSEARTKASRKILEEAKSEALAKEKIIYDIDLQTGEVKGKEAVSDYGAHKREAQSFLKAEEEKLRHKSSLQPQTREIDNEKMREALSNLSSQFQAIIRADHKKEVTKQHLHPKTSKVIQHDDYYDAFLEYHKEFKSQLDEDKSHYDEQLYDLHKVFNHKCISMWQPWASLVIMGIKRFEGRGWNTGYRGPLWIQAGAKPPEKDDIRSCEKMYSELYSGTKIPSFPSSFPEKSIIGVVDLQDVWTQEEFKAKVPAPFNEESSQPFVFVFRNPRKLLVPIKYAGQQAIFDLPFELVKSAIHSLTPVSTSFAPYFAKKYFTPDNKAIQKQQQFDLFDKKIKLKVDSKAPGFLLFNVDEEICLRFVKRMEGMLKKSLKVGYDFRKSFEFNEEFEPELLLETMKVAQQKYGSQQDSLIIDSQILIFDIFRLNNRVARTSFEKPYKFFLCYGDGVVFAKRDQKNRLTLNEDELLLIENSENLLIEQLIAQPMRTTLNPVDDYTVVVLAAYKK